MNSVQWTLYSVHCTVLVDNWQHGWYVGERGENLIFNLIYAIYIFIISFNWNKTSIVLIKSKKCMMLIRKNRKVPEMIRQGYNHFDSKKK